MITSENLYFLLLQVFSSGVAGYITNKYAVNMIFKEYTPLKIGGAVKKNKEKFIEEISDLVERDIINSSTIKDNVINEDFKQTMDLVVQDFLSKSLNEVFGDITIGEISGLEETVNNSEYIIRDNLGNIMSRLFTNISDHLKVEDILSDNQISSIVDYIYKEISNNINKNNGTRNLILDLYKEQGHLCLNQIVSKETADKVTRIISCEIMNSIDELLDSKKETKQIVDKILSLIDIKSVMKELQKSFGSKTIEELISEEGIDKLGLVIYKNLDKLIKSEEGNEKIHTLIDEGINSAKNIDLTIFEILPIHFGRTSSEYIGKIIRNITPYFISWIEKNKEKIEIIVDNSIYESIENIDDELRKSMILKVKDSMFADFSSKNQIVNKISDFIKSYGDNEEISSKLYDKVIKFLEETKLKDIVNILEENGLLDNEKITEIILNKWEDCGEEISKDLLKKQSSKTINNIINQDFYRLFNKNIKPNLYELINNNKDKIMSYLDGTIFNFVHSKVDGVLDSKINDLVGEERVSQLSKLLPNKLNSYLGLKSYDYKKYICNEISNYIRYIKLDEMINSAEDKIVKSSIEKIIEFGKRSIDKYKIYKVKDVIQNISGKEEFINKITEKTYEEISDNLPSIVNGNVKKVIYDNLIKLDEDEICNIAQSFMGKQLKPLSMFGALLGSIVGLVFSVALQNINGLYGFYNNYQNTIIACLILGGVGVMTNIIALWMIFCPYEKNTFVSKIPIFRIFSIGYIPAHKNSFASGMAYFIDNELLSGNRLSNLFKSKRHSIKINIFNSIVNRYNKILNLINSKKQSINNYLYSLIIKKCRKNNNAITNFLSNTLLKIEGRDIISKDLLKSKIKSYINNINKYENQIVDYFEEKLKVNKSMSDILPQYMITSINKKVNQDLNIFIKKSLEEEYIEKTIKNIILNNSQIYNSLMNKTLKEVISEKIFVNIEKSFKSEKSINILLLQLKDILSDVLGNYINTELNEEKRFDELFNGKIKNKIDKDLYSLTEKSIDKVTVYTKENVNIISSSIVKVVRDNLNFFVKMAYDFADGDGLVRDVVDNIINNKLELLLTEEKNELANIIYNCLDKEIYPSKIKDLGITSKEIDSNLLLDRFVYGLKQSDDFKNSIYNTSDLVIDSISQLKVREIAESLNMNTIDLAYNKCENGINLLEKNIVENLKTNTNEANEFIYELVNNKILVKFYAISLVEISWEINRPDINYTVDNLFKLIGQSKVINNYALSLCDDMYDLSVNKVSLNEVLNKDELEKDISNSLNICFENKDFNDKNKVLVDNTLDIFIKDEFEFVDHELKTFITNEIIEATLNTAERNITPLLKALDLQSITLNEVANMHPKEIHMLFKSFAGDFFKKLYIYGAFGFIFGVNVYLSIILLLIDIVYTKKIEEKVVNLENNLFRE